MFYMVDDGKERRIYSPIESLEELRQRVAEAEFPEPVMVLPIANEEHLSRLETRTPVNIAIPWETIDQVLDVLEASFFDS